jgi:hypothetical protein
MQPRGEVMEIDDLLSPMAEATIVEALESARKRALAAEQKRSELDRAITAAREEQRLLERLLALRRNGSAETTIEPIPVQIEANVSVPRTGESLLQVVLQELEAAGRPLHISELMRLLKDRNAPIPGSGTQANLITYLRRDARIVRPSRGMYALAASGLPNMVVPQRKRRRRKHMRSARIQERTNP